METTMATITSMTDINQWRGDIDSLIAACLAVPREDIDALVGAALVSKTLSSYLHYEPQVMPNYDNMGGLQRETAEQLRLAWKPLRVAVNHRALRDAYDNIMTLYDEVPVGATGRAAYIKQARTRPEMVRLVEYGVSIHRRCHQLILNDTRSEAWRTISHNLLVNKRSIPLTVTPDEYYERIVTTLTRMAEK